MRTMMNTHELNFLWFPATTYTSCGDTRAMLLHLSAKLILRSRLNTLATWMSLSITRKMCFSEINMVKIRSFADLTSKTYRSMKKCQAGKTHKSWKISYRIKQSIYKFFKIRTRSFTTYILWSMRQVLGISFLPKKNRTISTSSSVLR